jgi:hypothetical protein
VLPLRRADLSSRGVLPIVVCLSVIRCNSDALHLQSIGRRGENKKEIKKQSDKYSEKMYFATRSIINIFQVFVINIHGVR